MQDGVITIHGHKGDRCSTIKVHLSFDVPEEMMKILVNDIREGVERWENRVIMHENGRIAEN